MKWLSNLGHGAWKGTISAGAWALASSLIHLYCKDQSSLLCVIAGSPVFLTVWSALAGVGVKGTPAA